MGAFEYLLLFAAVILGLAISDLAVSMHRLLNAAERVRWDGLSILAAALAFERIVIQWWTWHGAGEIAVGFTFGMFLGILVSTTLLFLMAAVALPDEIHPQIDLRLYYAKTSRRFWLLFTLQWVVFNIVSIWAQHTITRAHINILSAAWVIPVVGIALAFVKNRLVQGIGLSGFLVFYLGAFFAQKLL